MKFSHTWPTRLLQLLIAFDLIALLSGQHICGHQYNSHIRQLKILISH